MTINFPSSFSNIAQPKRTTLVYENLEFDLDHETHELTVTNADGTREMTFDLVELKELRTALTALGLEAADPYVVNVR